MEWVKIVLEVFALIFTGIQILLLTIQIKNAVKWNKLNSTFEEIDKLSTLIDDMNPELLDEIGLLKYDDSNVDVEIFKKLIENPEHEKDLYRIMHFYESFAVSVLSGYINENIAKRLYYENNIRTYKKMAGYILLRRQTSGFQVYQHLERLYNQWNSENVNFDENNFEKVRNKRK